VTAVHRPAIRFLRVTYRSNQNSLLLQCSYRYLEALLDGLLARAPKRSLWWQEGRRSLMRGAEIRQRRMGRETPYDSAFPVPPVLSSSDSEAFRDEAIWHIARHLADLYGTIPYSENERALIALEDHRYETHLGAAVLPSPEASSKFPVATWDMILRNLAHSIYADFLLWCLQRHFPETPVMDVITSSSSTLDFLTAGRRSSSTPLPGGSWEATLTQAPESAPAELAARLRQTVSSITYDSFNSLLEAFLLLLPSPLGTSFTAQIPDHREELIASGCACPSFRPRALKDSTSSSSNTSENSPGDSRLKWRPIGSLSGTPRSETTRSCSNSAEICLQTWRPSRSAFPYSGSVPRPLNGSCTLRLTTRGRTRTFVSRTSLAFLLDVSKKQCTGHVHALPCGFRFSEWSISVPSITRSYESGRSIRTCPSHFCKGSLLFHSRSLIRGSLQRG
jgi:hypothetical protein